MCRLTHVGLNVNANANTALNLGMRKSREFLACITAFKEGTVRRNWLR